jgi:hypothetical protein
MIPKIETAIDAVEAGVKAAVILDGRIPHVLLLELFTEHGAGTMITRNDSAQAHSGPSRAWGGQFRLCAKDTDFSLQIPNGAPSCGSDDAFTMPFAAVSPRGQTSWTTTFTESPVINSFYAAQKAGMARLLGDIGYKGDLGEGKTPYRHAGKASCS